MYSILRLAALVILLHENVGYSSRILGIFPTETKSHYIMYGKVLQAMAEKGHHVTVVTHFPGLYKAQNYSEISVKGLSPLSNVELNYFLDLSYIGNVYDVIGTSVQSCEDLLKHQFIADLIHGQYDLVVVEMFAGDCFLPVAYKLGVPIVGIVSSVTLPWVNDMVANPDDTSYIHSYFFPFTQRMSLIERIANTVVTLQMKYIYQYESTSAVQKIAEKAFGPLPPIEDMARNISMILVNSHYSLSQIKPWVPQIVEVGGLHIEDKIDPLPKDIEHFLETSKHGIVYFSFGTIFPIEDLPEDVLSVFFNVFNKLKENIIWKANTTSKDPNILERKWLPQIPILCHPSTKVFISHGGLLGLQEAIYCGVPVLGIPFFADQRFNLMALKEKGIARVLEYKNINEKTLSENLNQLLTDKSYIEKAKLHSKIFRDRPIHPLNLSVYWLEYVLKYKGASHLKSPALELKWYQYRLLDVYFILIISSLIVLRIIYKGIKYIYSICSKASKKSKNTLQTNGKKYK